MKEGHLRLIKIKKYLFIPFSILLLATACTKQPVQKSEEQKNDILVSDLVNYFNAKLDDCSYEKPTPCFDQALKTKDENVYFSPEYQLVDFTGDGSQDALVTIQLSGTGAYREFFALTKDSQVQGEKSQGLILSYFNQVAGYPKLENGVYTLVCPSKPETKFTTGEPSCVYKIQWYVGQKKFIETKLN